MPTTAYPATDENLAIVLASHWEQVQDRDGKTAETLAAELYPLLDFEEIEKAALLGDDLDEQTNYANGEIHHSHGDSLHRHRELRRVVVHVPFGCSAQ